MLAAATVLGGCHRSPAMEKLGTADMSQGTPLAPVTLTEYASVTCADCARFDTDVLPMLETTYIATGKLHYVYREMATDPVSTAGALLARCSGKSGYFPVIDAIMRAQAEMTRTQDYQGILMRIARTQGMTTARFNACVTDAAGQKRLNDNLARYRRRYDVTSAPAFFINGKRFAYKGGGVAEFDAAFKPYLNP